MRASKRDSIVEAAARLIRTEGVHAASISEIMRESSASTGTIYHHFANKNEIVLAVAHSAVVDPLEEILAGAGAGEGRSPGELLRLILDAVMGGDVESALIVQLWAGSSSDPQLKEIMRSRLTLVHAGITRELSSWLAARGVTEPGDRAIHLAHVTLGQAMGLLAERTLLPDIDRDAYIAEAARLLDAAASLD